ncbi:MAG: hydroxymethylglutaryl-CoA lyase [Candidatus Rokubacteria bacterium]|nr:hydroxymethylglutaryl-CoA lyase [Candidatus Rokubacteria bacterium]
MLNLPKRATVVEVGPRDGLQSLDTWIPTERKVAMVDRLSEAGFPVIEVTGFAHPRVIPNLRDAEDVMAKITRRPGTIYRALVPNAKGAARAAESTVDEMLGLLTVSETYCRKNQNMSVDEAIDQAAAALEIASRAGARFVMAMGMSFFCPYEGRIPEERTLAVFAKLWERGIRRFYLAGSLGMEDPRHVNAVFGRIRDRWPEAEVGFHVHNIAGFGAANIVAALDGGASSIEGSICGIGGGIVMPTSMGSVGNLATEDIVHLLNEMGVDTGMETREAIAAAHDVSAILGIQPASYASRCGTREDVMERGRASPRQHPR